MGQAGRVLVFDDSLNHTVWHRGNGSTPRTVLLVRVWHPEVSIRERQVALQLMQSGHNTMHAWHEDDISKALHDLSSPKAAESWSAQERRLRQDVGNRKTVLKSSA